MKDFFISYNKADRAWAEWIAWQLEEAGYTVIVQAWDFRPGSNFVLGMQQAAIEGSRTIAVLSPDYLAAMFTQPEWAAAFAQDPTGEKGTLLPVRVRECEIKGLLHPIVYIDLFKLEEATAKRELLDGVKRDRAKPESAPDFPGASPRAISSKPRFPGAMPSIWNVPHLRNPNFTGREDELAQLRASLLAGETTALVQAQAIHGLGGVGKTQLAIEYAYRHGADYDAVWWVRSEDPTTLASEYAGLAAKLNLPEKDAAEQRVIVEAVKGWLRKNRGWLLVFDNAEDVDLVREYIPRGSAGHIIVTSRNPNWTGVATPLSVRALPIEKAIEFLLKRTGHQDSATAKLLAEALGRLPLALEQAGAYIETSGCTMPHYLELFESRQRELLQHGKPSTEYPYTVATTWSISFQNVEIENRAGAELLRLCAFFAPDDIPIKMLVAGAEEMPEALAPTAADTLLLDEALMALRKYSLVEVENETISIHRLVQSVIRHALVDEAFTQWIRTAVHILHTSFTFDPYDVRTWPICAPLLPHASAALTHAEAIQFVSNETSRLLNQIGLYLEARAEYAQAKRMFERALAIDEATLGPSHPTVAILLGNLGEVLREQGDLAGAKAFSERALAIDEAALDANHPDVAVRLNNLGNVLMDQGDLAGAKSLYERALGISEAALGSSHPSVAIRLNNLGFVLKALGELAGAKCLYERAGAIDESTLGTNHPHVAIDLNNLGTVLRSQGDFAGAKSLFARALAIDQAAFGPNNPNVARDFNNLGQVLRELGDLAGAKALFERALQIFREFLGDDHPNTRTVEENLRLLQEELKSAE
jgi:tetratricopeptide (TPR) repeat protein